jgi:hypothetical protein
MSFESDTKEATKIADDLVQRFRDRVDLLSYVALLLNARVRQLAK